jgi:hypothetical protein
LKKGVFTHGPLKTFLTRGLFKSIFKPLLYSKEDHIHSNFLNVLNNCIIKIDNLDQQYQLLLSFWLVHVPKLWFETIFIKDERGFTYLNLVEKSDTNNGEECAYISQAYTLWIIEQFLKNDKNFQQTVTLSISDFENVSKLLLGNSKIITYLSYFRSKFDIDKMDIDPRDWPIFYIYEIADLLIGNKQLLNSTLQGWDKDIIRKTEFIVFGAAFFAEQKDKFFQLISE